MGRHHDQETIKFIDALKKKGEELAFKVTDEYKELDGEYFIDLVWTPYEQLHNIFITFEIETEENDRLYKNLDKIFELPATDLEKPFHHFTIIYKGNLTKGNKHLMLEKARNNNVSIFEDLKNNNDEFLKFYKELEDLKISIFEQIKRQGSVNPVETVRETILGLGNITPILIIANQPYPINQATLTSGSQDFQGKPVIMSSGQLFDSKKYKQFAVVPIPREVYTLVIPGTSIAIDTYKEHKIANGTTSLTLELCNYSIVINLELKKGSKGIVETKIDPNEADAIQLKKFEDLLRGLYEKKILEIYDQKTKKVFCGEGIASKDYKIYDEWYSNVSDLAFIKEETSTRIPAPKDLMISNEDFHQIQMIKTVIQTGEFSGAIKEASITASKDIISKMIESIKNHGSMDNLKLAFNNSDQPLLTANIPLGEVTYEFKDVIFKDPVEKIQQLLDETNSEVEIKVVLVPNSSKSVKAVYPKWKKVKT